MMRDIKDDVKKVLYSEEQLAKRVKEMAEEISKDYAGKDLLVVGILKGSVLFTSDLGCFKLWQLSSNFRSC